MIIVPFAQSLCDASNYIQFVDLSSLGADAVAGAVIDIVKVSEQLSGRNYACFEHVSRAVRLLVRTAFERFCSDSIVMND